MTPQQFIAKWQRSTLSERSACQQHFLDLCELLGHPKPAEADPEGASFTFERGCRKTDGEQGWADVWKRDFFGWEYKGKHKDLAAAYRQLQLYREDLQNPPLLVVCDMDRFQVHTNFTGTAKQRHEFDLAGLADPAHLDVLRKVFFDPEALRPGITNEKITVEAADRFAELADGMRDRGIEPQRAAHFLMKLMFCMFGEDTGLLPPKLFGKLLETAKANPAILLRRLESLFSAMAKGGDYGSDAIPWFNGGLFADIDVIPLTREEINTLANVSQKDWSSVEPSVFGTLFERTLDPGKRSQIGAHYTSRKDIETLLVPVLLAPLRREWEEVKRKCEEQLWPKVVKAVKASGTRAKTAGAKESRERKAFDRALLDFIERLAHVSVLDPACGSGNFLYVAIHMLLDLEKEAITYAAGRGLSLVPRVNPSQLHGLEINPYAQQLAQVVIWIGYLQWMHHNGFKMPDHPVLAPIETIHCQDAILDLSDPEHPKEPDWPEAEFIVGNPPFLGTKKLRSELGDQYVEALFRLYGDRLPNFSDLCCYWFEKARYQIERGRSNRAGLLATQGIRGGLNREVLSRIKKAGGIFFAESDRDWILDGATVHVSMVGFDSGKERTRHLDGREVVCINANLTATADVTKANRLGENQQMGFIADVKAGKFDIPLCEALELLHLPNPNCRPNSDVLRPWANGRDVVQRSANSWIIDFGWDMPLDRASEYEAPFKLIQQRVYPERAKVKRKRYREFWWLHAEPCAVMRQHLARLDRFIVTTTVSKHRLFAWLSASILPDHQLVAFTRDDWGLFGVLHSRIHEVWALQQGTQVRERESGFRYTPTTCFETFPLPSSPPDKAAAVAQAATDLEQRRNNWLDPPEWTKTEVLEFPGSVDGPWARYIQDVEAPVGRVSNSSHKVGRVSNSPHEAIGTVRWPRLVPKDADCAESLKKRTLTNLYNERPAWLDLAHQKLDAAVFAAYGWDPSLSDEEILERLLELNLARAT